MADRPKAPSFPFICWWYCVHTYVLCTTDACVSVHAGVTGEEGPVTVSVHVTSHAVPLVPSSSEPEAPASFTTEIAVKPSPPPRCVL